MLNTATSPRNTAALVHITTHPAFVRAPMLTSKIHSQWDPEFCKSTSYQLTQSNLTWSDIWLTDTERAIVSYHEQKGLWLTPAQWKHIMLSLDNATTTASSTSQSNNTE